MNTRKLFYVFIAGFLVFFATNHASAIVSTPRTSTESTTQSTIQPRTESNTGSDVSSVDVVADKIMRENLANREALIRSTGKSYPTIYAVKNGVKSKIKDIKQLRARYSGFKIENVPEATLNLYNGKVINDQAYKEGSLIRDLSSTIYVVGNDTLKKISSLTDLVKDYAGQQINDIVAFFDNNNKEYTNKDLGYSVTMPYGWSTAVSSKIGPRKVFFGEKANSDSGEGEIYQVAMEVLDSKMLTEHGAKYWSETKRDFSMQDLVTKQIDAMDITMGTYKYQDGQGVIAFIVSKKSNLDYVVTMETGDKAKIELFSKMVQSFKYLE
ncbi:MAG: hypothetical protein NTY12_05010 [Candidatus Falkowbacteria bacterium]|nr:hypothetical protein [Candidatus Falkowbacteria bacterium]